MKRVGHPLRSLLRWDKKRLQGAKPGLEGGCVMMSQQKSSQNCSVQQPLSLWTGFRRSPLPKLRPTFWTLSSTSLHEQVSLFLDKQNTCAPPPLPSCPRAGSLPLLAALALGMPCVQDVPRLAICSSSLPALQPSPSTPWARVSLLCWPLLVLGAAAVVAHSQHPRQCLTFE